MSFDRLAPFYPAMETVLAGEKLQRCRLAFLSDAAEAQQILLIGEGHGRFLAELLKANPRAHICCVDASSRMLAINRKRLADSPALGRVQFVPRSIQEFRREDPFDFVATHFFLDCFTEPELAEIVPKIAGFVKPDGSWLLGDFQVPKKGWRRLRGRLVLWMAYTFFRSATRLSADRIVPPQSIIAGQGFTCLKRREFNFGLLYAELWRKGAAAGATF